MWPFHGQNSYINITALEISVIHKQWQKSPVNAVYLKKSEVMDLYLNNDLHHYTVINQTKKWANMHLTTKW